MTALALPRLWGVARTRARGRAEQLALVPSFDDLGGPVLAVCGLHGGAGTTTLAAALAYAYARVSLPERVLLVEADPAGGELAVVARVASPLGLGELALRLAAGAPPQEAPHAVGPGGLRVLAGRAVEPVQVDAGALRATLAQARGHHGLVVVDAGRIRDRHAAAALELANLVVWTSSGERLHDRAGVLLGPLARPARTARWLLATSGRRPPRGLVRSLAGELDGWLRLPGDVEDPARRDELAARVGERLR